MKFLFDLFPVIVFFAAFKIYGIYVATGVAIAATLAQVAWMWFRHRRVDRMLWASLGLIVVLGGATLLLRDETFIKWKPTVLYWLFAGVLAGGLAFGRNLIRTMLEEQVRMPDAGWRRLLWSWIAFFSGMGVLNLYVAYTFPTDTWVNFKLFGGMGLLLAFVVAQGFMLAKYMEPGENR